MGGISDAIKYLYDKFILRDVLSFITPGAIVVVAATYLFFPEVFCYSIPWPFYIVIFGVFFVVGFAIQCFGEIIGFIRFTPYPKNDWRRRGRIFLCNWREDYCDRKSDKSNIWFWGEHKEVAKFMERSRDDADARQGYERIVILQQMCGNNFLAIIIALLLIAVELCGSPLYLLIIGVPLLVSLYWGFRVMLLRKYVREIVFRRMRPPGRDQFLEES